jgi:hypothetical protein
LYSRQIEDEGDSTKQHWAVSGEILLHFSLEAVIIVLQSLSGAWNEREIRIRKENKIRGNCIFLN